MSPEVFHTFEQIFDNSTFTGPVLEIGTMPGADSLLNLPAFNQCSERIGINLIPQQSDSSITFIQADANDMNCFSDHYFDAVVCNATMEHDRFFWKTLSEIRRITAQDAVVAIGVPGYAGMGMHDIFKKQHLLRGMLVKLAGLYDKENLSASALTLGEHFFPSDYYRFSRQAVQEIFFEGFKDVAVYETMNPPRFIGVGKKA